MALISNNRSLHVLNASPCLVHIFSIIITIIITIISILPSPSSLVQIHSLQIPIRTQPLPYHPSISLRIRRVTPNRIIHNLQSLVVPPRILGLEELLNLIRNLKASSVYYPTCNSLRTSTNTTPLQQINGDGESNLKSIRNKERKKILTFASVNLFSPNLKNLSNTTGLPASAG